MRSLLLLVPLLATTARAQLLPPRLFLAASFASADVGVAVGGAGEADPGVICRTTDGGKAWTPVALPDGVVRLYDVQLLDERDGYACGLGGVLLRTVDGGVTWQRVATPFDKAWFAAVHFVDAKRGVLAGASGEALLATTVDGGATWVRVAVPPVDGGVTDVRDVVFVGKDLGFACGSGGLLLRTTDGGVTWARVEVGTKAWLRSLWLVDAKTGFVAAGDGKVHATADGGATWSVRGVVGGKVNGIAFDAAGKVGVLATMNGGVWRSEDGGATWKSVQQTSRDLTCVVRRKDGRWLVFGDEGVVLSIGG